MTDNYYQTANDYWRIGNNREDTLSVFLTADTNNIYNIYIYILYIYIIYIYIYKSKMSVSVIYMQL